MKKKILSSLLVTLLFSNALPVMSFADELTDTMTESTEQTEEQGQETTPSPSDPIVDVPKETPPVEKEPVGPPIQETAPPEQPVIPTPPPVVTETTDEAPLPQEQAYSPQDTVPPEVPTNEVVIPVEAGAIHFDKNQTTEEFIARIGESARTVGLENELYGSVMIAQAILESGSGGSELSKEPYNNLFGIKGAYEGQSVSFGTQEDDGAGNYYSIQAAFRKYPSVKESFEDYSTLLKEGIDSAPMIYQGTWKTVATTYQDATEALTGSYATDTLYNQKLNALIETYNLTQYDHEKEDVVVGGDFEPYNNVNYDTNYSYAFGNCTIYAYNRITQLGGHVDLDMGNGADWGKTGVARGYHVSHTPKAGTAVSFSAGVLGADSTYGHVGFVERVNEDGSILISEMNAQGLNVISTRTIQADYVGMLTYITPK